MSTTEGCTKIAQKKILPFACDKYMTDRLREREVLDISSVGETIQMKKV